MKKAIAIILTLVIVLSCVAGCTSKPVEKSGVWVCNAVDGVKDTEYVICVSKAIPDGQTLLTEINKVIDSLDVEGILGKYMQISTRRQDPGEGVEDLHHIVKDNRDKEGDDPILFYTQTFDPFQYSGAGGEFMDGIDIMISYMAAVNLGRSIQFFERPYDFCYSSVKSGTGDIFATGVALTDTVKNDFLVSKVYTTGKQCIISDKNEGYTKLSQLKGKVIGVVSSRPGEIMVREALEGKATIVEYENETEVKRALKDQHVDYIVIDELPAELLVQRLNGEKQ